MFMTRIERVAYDLEYAQLMQKRLKEKLSEDRCQGPHTQADMKEEIAHLASEEVRLSRLLIELEDCEHTEVEDTGGPDGSRVCLDCGKEW